MNSTKQRLWWLSGSVALAILAMVTVLPLLAVFVAAGDIPWRSVLGNTYIRRVVSFSFYQATLSTALSVSLAIPVALALSHERNFPGRHWLVSLFGLSLVIPSIVAIYGIVAVFGRTGWLNSLLESIHLSPISIYGLGGILLAHVFFNLPLATRVILQSLEQIPEEQWRQAHQLGLGTWTRFRLIELPTIKRQLIGLIVLVFALCFTSFAIVMTLGGGPRATTIEVAIYQAIRFDFDIGKAVALACIQLAAGALVIGVSAFFKADQTLDISTRGFSRAGGSVQTKETPLRFSNAALPGIRNKAIRFFIILLTALFILAPLLTMLLSAANQDLKSTLLDPITIRATINTVVIAVITAMVSVGLCLGLLFTTRHLRIRLKQERVGNLLQQSGNVILILPPLVIGTGLFLFLRPYADVFALGLLLVIIVNSLMALPFVLRTLDAPMMQLAQSQDRLVQAMGLYGWQRFRLIDWPLLRKPIGLSLGIAAALAAGDLSAIALFGSDRVRTLSYVLYQRMASYQLDAAAVTAGLLLLTCFILFMGLQRLAGGTRARA